MISGVTQRGKVAPTARALRLSSPLLFATLFVVYLAVLQPWLIDWGATDEERRLSLPGDDVVPDPPAQLTRAITIRAPVAEVWPWLAQIGQDRAGFYSYDWLENLFSANIHNANAIHPEWQHRAVGDAVPLARPDYLGGRFAELSRPRVVAVEPEWALVLRGWGAFVLRPIDAGTTRLIVRERVASTDAGPVERAIGAVVGPLLWDPAHFAMERQMLRGLKARAEGRSDRPDALALAARGGWALAGVGLAGLSLAKRWWWPWLLAPFGIAAPVLASTGDADAALAGFLAVGITLMGALAFGRAWWPPFALMATVVLSILGLVTK